jgi:molybdenum cofactor guanylyltransferase
MTVLGAILAGGQSRRFGSDKAAALIGDVALLDHVARALAPQVTALVVVGRSWPGLDSVADRPGPHLGPLGGLCGALHHAATNNYGEVLTAPCDTLPVPPALLALLPGDGAVLENFPLFGRWPATLAQLLDDYLKTTDDRSMRGWIAWCGVGTVPAPPGLVNTNTPDKLPR